MSPLSNFKLKSKLSVKNLETVEAINEIFLLSALKSETLRLMGSVTRKIKEEFKLSIPKDNLQKLFA